MTDFYLKSIELRDYDVKHHCSVLKVVDGNKLLVAVSPPIPAHVYKQENDLDRIVLAPRYVGTEFTSGNLKLPCVVNICIAKSLDDWNTGPWRLLDIGEASES